MNNVISEIENKLKYQTPVLTVFGKLKDMTQSGSGTNTEQSTGMNTCDADTMRKPC
jgi:hypothetical protein